MATCCFGRTRLTGAAALPLSLRRAWDFAAVFRAGALRAVDFFWAALLAAARAAGFLDFFLAMFSPFPTNQEGGGYHNEGSSSRTSEAIASVGPYRRHGRA